MSNFDYHTGYLPVVMNEKEHRRLIIRRVLLGIAVVGAIILWLNQSPKNTAYQSSDISYQETTAQESTVKAEAPKKLGKPSLSISTARQKIKQKDETGITKKVSEKKASNISAVDTTDLENSYQKDIENILKQAFPK